MPPHKHLLAVNGLFVEYGQTTVLAGIDLVVAPGEVVGIVGPNGSGKSTLLGALSGEKPIRAGSVRLNGVEVGRLRSDQRFHVGLVSVPQGAVSLFNSLTVDEHLRLATRCFPSTERGGRIEAVLNQFSSLLPLRRKTADLLSGGQRQMLSIAIALATGPKVLLIDEPSHGLSVGMRHRIVELLGRLRSFSRAIVIAEQFPCLAGAMCDRVLGIESGRLHAAQFEM